ncbi:oxidoreductase alpha [Arthrobacter sp. Hiyo8]|nr:oxidoreductase alpha [Arthrobacter sp. Hiyo8]
MILVHEDDLGELGFEDRDMVDVISTFRGTERRADKFRLVAYPTAKVAPPRTSPRPTPWSTGSSLPVNPIPPATRP